MSSLREIQVSNINLTSSVWVMPSNLLPRVLGKKWDVTKTCRCLYKIGWYEFGNYSGKQTYTFSFKHSGTFLVQNTICYWLKENDRSRKLEIWRKQEQQLLKAQEVAKVTPKKTSFFFFRTWNGWKTKLQSKSQKRPKNSLKR